MKAGSCQKVFGSGTIFVSIVISEVVSRAAAVVAKPSFLMSLTKSITVTAVLWLNNAMEATPMPASRPMSCVRTKPRSGFFIWIAEENYGFLLIPW